MRIDVITLFPGMFEGPLTESIIARAREQGILELKFHDLREFGLGNYKQVDDSPYGGGAGMVMRVDVVARAIEEIFKNSKFKIQNSKLKPYRIYLSPKGKRLTQTRVERLAKKD